MSGSAGRDRLLDRVAEHVLAHGTSGQSLSGIARAVGSNNRMLLYYFGGKENLLDEACQRAVRSFPTLARALDHVHDEPDLRTGLTTAWDAITDPGNLPFLRLFFERYGSALRDPAENSGYLDRMALTGWPAELAGELLARGVGAAAARRAGLEVVALWRGLQLALLAGADRGELTAVHDAAVGRLVRELGLERNTVAPRS